MHDRNDGSTSRPTRRQALVVGALGTLLLVALVALATVGVMVWGGAYDVAADRPHTQLVHDLLETTMRRSVRTSGG